MDTLNIQAGHARFRALVIDDGPGSTNKVSYEPDETLTIKELSDIMIMLLAVIGSNAKPLSTLQAHPRWYTVERHFKPY